MSVYFLKSKSFSKAIRERCCESLFENSNNSRNPGGKQDAEDPKIMVDVELVEEKKENVEWQSDNNPRRRT